MEELRHHLAGWRAKVTADFGNAAYQAELDALVRDPVYGKFHLATPEYVLIRLMGRMSVSIGRRLGEIYDKIPRLAAQARYQLSRDKVVAKFEGLELDVRVRLTDLNTSDREHAIKIAKKHLGCDLKKSKGLGIEIRYNFNPNDSARLRKDKDMARCLQKAGLYPVYLVFAENSPRLKDAVASLTRSGWNFVIGREALQFMADLVGFDISNVLDEPTVAEEIRKEMRALMDDIRLSHAFTAAFVQR